MTKLNKMTNPEYNNLSNNRKTRGRPSPLSSSKYNPKSNNNTNPTNNDNAPFIDPSTAATLASIPHNPPSNNCLRNCCGCRYNPSVEKLDYDYSKEGNSSGKGGGKQDSNLPRIRQRGEFYIDSFNGESWSCSFGTNEEVCIYLL